MASSPKRKFISPDELATIHYRAALEYNMSIGFASMQGDGDCAAYLWENRERLLPKMIASAIEQGKDADQIVHRFVQGVHKRHKEGLPLS